MVKVFIRCLVVSVLVAIPAAAAFATGLLSVGSLSAGGSLSAALIGGGFVLVSAFASSLVASWWNAAQPGQGESGGPDQGVVKWFNVSKGFGFITLDEGGDVFVHFRDIRGKGHRSLVAGQRVAFHVKETEKGPQAHDVTVTAQS